MQDDSTANDENVILDQIETIYKNLYTSEENFSDEESDLLIRNLDSHSHGGRSRQSQRFTNIRRM